MSPSRRAAARSSGVRGVPAGPGGLGGFGGPGGLRGRGGPGDGRGRAGGSGPADGSSDERGADSGPSSKDRGPSDQDRGPSDQDGEPSGDAGDVSLRRRADRLEAAVVEQEGLCFWCRRPFSALVPPTTDHVVPRVKGGPSWRENEVAACRRCNGQRGHLGPVDWLEECLRRGWSAEPRELAATLARLDAAIAERGGQRRARPYLDGQRRKLDRGVG